MLSLAQLVLAGALALGAAGSAPAASTIYVDCTTGSDAGAGTLASPYASLARAQAAVRAALPAPPPGLTVYIQGDCTARAADGTFSNATQLTLGEEDSGAAGAPVTWAAWPGAPAAPRLLGGVPVPASAWAPAPAPAASGTLVADLGAGGLNVAQFGFGALGAGALGGCTDTAMELFYGGQAQVLARYPNIQADGAWEWLEITKVEDKKTTFSFSGSGVDHALTWPNASSPGVSAWIHGFFSYDWADSYVEIQSVTGDGAGGALITVEVDTPPVYGFLPKARFYGVNILSELDVAGEYYIDTAAGLLYWMPPAGGPDPHSPAYLSIAPALIAQANGTALSNVIFAGLELYYARGVGVSLGSSSNVNVSVLGVTSALHGHSGVALSGMGVQLRDSHIFGTGCAASIVQGGDLATLTRSNLLVVNNTIHDYARIVRTYNPGIEWFGTCGGTFSGNNISHAPHNGMLGGGALNLFEGNVFDTLLYEATDSGAFYVGRSWTQRGNVVRGNTFRNIRATEKTTLGYPSVQAIYLDDQQSGYVLEDNICEDSTTCFFVGGGRDIVVRNNTCRNTGTCLHMDARGLGSERAACTKTAKSTGLLVQQLLNVNYQQPPYSTAFPEMVNTLSDRPCTPVNVSFEKNFGCNVKAMIDASASELAAWGDVYTGNNSTKTC